jgi:spore coat-associated protein S
MAEAYKEDLESILVRYDIEVIDIRTESYKNKKGVWWIKTPGGYSILKKHSNSDKTLDFIIAAVEYLQGKGIRIPKVIPASNGEKYVCLNNCCYVLNEAIPGVNPSYSSREQLEKVVRELAAFHKASTGFVPPQGCKPRIHLGSWPKTYRERTDKLSSYHALENSAAVHGDFGTTILEEFGYFLQRARDSIIGLESSFYWQWVENSKKTGGLCHQDFAAGNLILTEAGEMYVLDIDSITMDIPVRDIRKLLLKVMKKRGCWEAGLTKDILAWYQAENPLEYRQWQVLKWELMHPHLFSGIMTKYYEKREESWTHAKYHRRLKEMVKVEKTIQPVIEGFETLIPR